MIADLSCLLARDLEMLEREIGLYPDDASLWAPVPGLANPGGTLAQHLIGNLRHFIGATLGATGYARHREAEFSNRTATREALRAELRETAREVRATLAGLDPAALEAPFPLEVGPGRPATGRFLLHLATHLAFHAGQLDYHRRAVTGDPTSAHPMGVAALLDGTPS